MRSLAPIRAITHTVQDVVTLPNLLTLARLPMAALVWYSPDARWLIGVLIAAAISDMLDGRVARALRARQLARGAVAGRVQQAAAVGAWLDPLCDKLFAASALAAVWVHFDASLAVVLLIAARELIVGPLAIAHRVSKRFHREMSIDFRAGIVGKTTTVAQYVAVAAVIGLPSAALPVAIATAVAGILASAIYIARAMRGMTRHSAAPERR